MDLKQKEQIEIEFYNRKSTEPQNIYEIENIIHKVGDAKVFYPIIKRFNTYFEKSQIILELGSGQSWGACLVKKIYPNQKVISTDISMFALEKAVIWEDLYKVKLDEAIECKSYEIPLEDESVDLIYCFEAAHHFVKHKESLAEIFRVLKKGGVCLYTYEPSCTKFFYPYAYKRVNKKRPEVPEDVLIFKEMVQFGNEVGFHSKYEFYPSLEKRGPVELIYYYMLNKLPFLQRILPCSVNYIFEKP